MVLENWMTGFIPDLVKVGQVLLALGLGLALGNMKGAEGRKVVMLCVAGLILGLCSAPFLSLNHVVMILFALTFLSGGLVAGAVLNREVLYGIAIIGCLGLGSSVFPLSGKFPAAFSLILLNFAGLGLTVWGAATLANWARRRQKALWPIIGVRILGSWLLAISALMLALQFAL